MTRRLAAVAAGVLVAAICPPTQGQTVPDGFVVNTVVSGLDVDAIGFAILPDGRVLVANQKSGTLDLLVAGALTNSIVTLPNLNASGNERGLLAVAVDPMWPDSNYVFVYYTMGDNYSRLLRLSASGSLDDGTSTNLSISIASPDTLVEMTDLASNHNGGTIRFGSDRSLYLSLGDDATRDSVQNLTTLHGKILRISPDPGMPLPSPNPTFPDEPHDALDEIFVVGLRNPFRFNIDPKTDRLIIGDVGQNAYEEVDLAEGGENLGWPRYEANDLFSDAYSLIPPDPTFPIYAYAQESGANSVMGLLTYRQADYPNDSSFPPEYEGTHFFADFYYGPIYNLRLESTNSWVADTFATGFARPVDATVLTDGSVYILEYGNALKRISYDPGPVVTLEGGVFLEGAYAGAGIMDTTLLDNGAIPLLQPYRDSLFDGTVLEFDQPLAVENVASGVVDWILAELRTGTSAATKVAVQTGFLHHDGTILGVEGEAGIHFPTVDSLNYYVVIRHRNHLPVMSAAPIDFTSGVGSWDIRTTASSAYVNSGPAIADFGDGRFGLFGGDTDADGQIIATDFNSWLTCTKAVETGYLSADLNLDVQCLADDFSLWLVNTKAIHESQVPE